MSKKKEKNAKKEEKEEKDQNSLTFKIITLGDSGVGKTSIINRYVNNKFSDNTYSTVGVNFSIKELYFNEQKINLKLIDTCGQEKYQSLTKAYLKNTDACFFIFALNDKESFENIKNWMVLFNEQHNIKDIPVMLLGNKSDLKNEIDDNLINEFVKSNNIKYLETSAKEKKNINESMEELGKMLYQKHNGSDKQHHKEIIISNKKPKKKKNCNTWINDFLHL